MNREGFDHPQADGEAGLFTIMEVGLEEDGQMKLTRQLATHNNFIDRLSDQVVDITIYALEFSPGSRVAAEVAI